MRGQSRRRRNATPPAEPILRRIAAVELVLVSSGGSDWLDGSGTAVKEDGGYRVTGRKIFGSGSPSGSPLLTTAVHDGPEDGPTVLHFGLDLKMEVVGGASFFRSLRLERCFRDIQGVRFHPFQERKQYLFSGRIALGLNPVK